MTSADPDRPAAPGAWSPLTFPMFRWVWIATVVSNIGTWFQEVAAGWLMTELSSSPLMVSLVQAATTFPMLLLALPAGALADILDRRRLLIVMTIWMTAFAAAMAAFQLGGMLSAWGLLGLLFMVQVGTAMTAPAWQAVVPELVPRTHLSAAIALNSVGINISRAIGPAIAGVVIASAGAGVAFIINAVSFFGVGLVLLRWKRTQSTPDIPPEHLAFAMVGGIKYIKHSPRFLAVLVRSFAFASCAVALWALLPLATQTLLGSDARGYGVLLACIGAGAVTGAVTLPPLRKRLTPNQLTTSVTILYAGSMLALSFGPPLWVAAILMLPAGLAWIAMLSTIHASAQFLLPAWVRARGLAVSLTVFFGSMALGALAWGALASGVGIALALQIAVGGLLLGTLTALKFKLPHGEGPDLAPAHHWPAPTETQDDRGPALITVEYLIDPANRVAFIRAARAIRRLRLRDGAISWDLVEDTDQPGRFVETFANRTWTDHLRMHERMTQDDLDIEASLRAFHTGEAPPRVQHFISTRQETTS